MKKSGSYGPLFLLVRRACSMAWRCESSSQPDRGEVIAKRKGVAASGPMIAEPISIKDAKRKFGGCAWKAIELISGDLMQVTDS